MAIEKSILAKDGFERTYHKIPSFSLTLQEDGTCIMKINTSNWKDMEARKNGSQPLNLQHCIVGLPCGVMKIGYEMLKQYFPEYDDGNDIYDDEWKATTNSKTDIKTIS